MKLQRQLLEALSEFDTSLIANTLDVIDSTPTHEIYMSGDIRSLTPSLGTRVGIAMTCKLDTSTPGGRPNSDLYWAQLEAMQRYDEPIVWVVETVGSRPAHECVMGDGMAKLLHSVGCSAVVTGGHVRDVDGMIAAPFAAFARGTCVHHCALRYVEADCPVSVGGITVQPGDIVHAGKEGVIRMPSSAMEKLLTWAPKVQSFEHAAHQVLQSSEYSLAFKKSRLADLRREFGFPG